MGEVIAFPKISNVEATPSEVEFDELSKERDRLNAINMATYAKLANNGIQINPVDLLMMRTETILEMVLADPVERMRFEIAFEQKMSEVFKGAESQIAAAKLGVQPSQTASGLILP